MQPVERALDLALTVMQNGGSTAMVDRTFKNVLKGLKLGPDSLEVWYHRRKQIMRVIRRPRGSDSRPRITPDETFTGGET
jgi:hypothetical protein